MSSIGLRIKQKIDESEYSIESLVPILGVSKQAIYKWIREEKISKGNVQKLANTLNVSVEWLMFGTGGYGSGNYGSDVFSFDLLDVQVSAGSGATLFEENVIQSISINKIKFQEIFRKEPTAAMKIVTARGDSMHPLFNDQDLLLVDTSITEVIDGVYIFRTNEELFCKRLQRLPNKIVCISDNKKYQQFDLPDEACIIAKVIDVWRHDFI